MDSALRSRLQHLLNTGDVAGARTLCEKARRKNPKDAEIRFWLGNLCARSGDTSQAIRHLEKAAAIATGAAAPHNSLGLAYLEKGEARRACASFRKASRLEPENPEFRFNLANALRIDQQLDEAQAEYERILEHNPALTGVLNNLGLTLLEKGDPAEAENIFRRSIGIDPKAEQVYRNLAKACDEQRKPEDAEQALRQALSLHPQVPELHWDLSLILLKLGKFKQGWEEYQWRTRSNGTPTRSLPRPVPRWQGEDLAGKHIIVTAEQGIGDEIMFASCYENLTQAAERVTIECEPRLEPLFQRSFQAAHVKGNLQSAPCNWFSNIPEPDFHVSAGDLPRQYMNPPPALKQRAFLHADPARLREWQERYRTLGDNLRVGISWKGGHISQRHRRVSRIEDWERLLRMPGITFVNLQYGDVAADIREARKRFGVTIHHWQDSDPLRDMDGFAAQVAALDMVISVDNSTVHLSAALGVPTWVLQPYNPDWRWGHQAQTSYWYQSVRQLHPEQRNDWRTLVNAAAEELHCLSNPKTTHASQLPCMTTHRHS